MKYFEIETIGDPNRDDAAFLDDVELVGVKSYHLGSGKSVSADFESASAHFDQNHKGKVLTPLLGNTDSLLVVNASVKDAIVSTCSKQHIECLPIKIYDHSGDLASEEYFIVNVVGRVNALNISASEVTYYGDGTARADQIVLDPNKLDADWHLFAVPERKRDLIASEALLKALLELPDRGNIFVRELGVQESPENEEQWIASSRLCTAVRRRDADEPVDEIVKLLEQGAEANFENDGDIAMNYAIENDDLDSASLLFDAGFDPKWLPTNPQNAPLVEVCRNGSVQMLELFLSKGADPRVENQIAGRPLLTTLVMSRYGHNTDKRDFPKMLELLVEAGADINRSVEDETTPLGEVLWENPEEEQRPIIEKMLELGADVNLETKYGTPLRMLVAMQWPADLVVKFIEAGADMNAGGVVHSAAHHEDSSLLKLLLDRGADVNCLHEGKTPLDAMVESRNIKAIDFLRSVGGETKATTLDEGEAVDCFAFDDYARKVIAAAQEQIIRDYPIEQKPEEIILMLDDSFGAESILYPTEEEDNETPIAQGTQLPKAFTGLALDRRISELNERYQLEIDISGFFAVGALPHVERAQEAIQRELPEVKRFFLGVGGYMFITPDGAKMARQQLVKNNRAVTSADTIIAVVQPFYANHETQAEVVTLFTEYLDQPPSYGLDELGNRIRDAAVQAVLENKESITAPIRKFKLWFEMFGSHYPQTVQCSLADGEEDQQFALSYEPMINVPYHIDDMGEDPLLPAFMEKHGIEEESMYWGDIFEVPSSVHWCEVIRASVEAAAELARQGIPFADDCEAVIGDYEDDSGGLEHYEKSIREAAAAFEDEKTRRDFAVLCYLGVDRQKWLLGNT